MHAEIHPRKGRQRGDDDADDAQRRVFVPARKAAECRHDHLLLDEYAQGERVDEDDDETLERWRQVRRDFYAVQKEMQEAYDRGEEE